MVSYPPQSVQGTKWRSCFIGNGCGSRRNCLPWNRRRLREERGQVSKLVVLVPPDITQQDWATEQLEVNTHKPQEGQRALPKPRPSKKIKGHKLTCNGQRWNGRGDSTALGAGARQRVYISLPGTSSSNIISSIPKHCISQGDSTTKGASCSWRDDGGSIGLASKYA